MQAWAFVFVMLAVGVVILYVLLGAPAPAPAPAPASAPAPAPIPSDIRDYKPEAWCLMSEDALGRWCSQNVPNCPADRFYTSRDACELVDASSMPLNIVTKQHVLPLARAALLGV